MGITRLRLDVALNDKWSSRPRVTTAVSPRITAVLV